MSQSSDNTKYYDLTNMGLGAANILDPESARKSANELQEKLFEKLGLENVLEPFTLQVAHSYMKGSKHGLGAVWKKIYNKAKAVSMKVPAVKKTAAYMARIGNKMRELDPDGADQFLREMQTLGPKKAGENYINRAINKGTAGVSSRAVAAATQLETTASSTAGGAKASIERLERRIATIGGDDDDKTENPSSIFAKSLGDLKQERDAAIEKLPRALQKEYTDSGGNPSQDLLKRMSDASEREARATQDIAMGKFDPALAQGLAASRGEPSPIMERPRRQMGESEQEFRGRIEQYNKTSGKKPMVPTDEELKEPTERIAPPVERAAPPVEKRAAAPVEKRAAPPVEKRAAAPVEKRAAAPEIDRNRGKNMIAEQDRDITAATRKGEQRQIINNNVDRYKQNVQQIEDMRPPFSTDDEPRVLSDRVKQILKGISTREASTQDPLSDRAKQILKGISTREASERGDFTTDNLLKKSVRAIDRQPRQMGERVGAAVKAIESSSSRFGDFSQPAPAVVKPAEAAAEAPPAEAAAPAAEAPPAEAPPPAEVAAPPAAAAAAPVEPAPYRAPSSLLPSKEIAEQEARAALNTRGAATEMARQQKNFSNSINRQINTASAGEATTGGSASFGKSSRDSTASIGNGEFDAAEGDTFRTAVPEDTMEGATSVLSYFQKALGVRRAGRNARSRFSFKRKAEAPPAESVLEAKPTFTPVEDYPEINVLGAFDGQGDSVRLGDSMDFIKNVGLLKPSPSDPAPVVEAVEGGAADAAAAVKTGAADAVGAVETGAADAAAAVERGAASASRSALAGVGDVLRGGASDFLGGVGMAAATLLPSVAQIVTGKTSEARTAAVESSAEGVGGLGAGAVGNELLKRGVAALRGAASKVATTTESAASAAGRAASSVASAADSAKVAATDAVSTVSRAASSTGAAISEAARVAATGEEAASTIAGITTLLPEEAVAAAAAPEISPLIALGDVGMFGLGLTGAILANVLGNPTAPAVKHISHIVNVSEQFGTE